MSDTHTVTVGNKGRIVLPADLRESRGWPEGSVLLLLETDEGVLLLTRDELERQVHADFAGLDLVTELLEQRRTEAAKDAAK
jgi:AbrB family looped-hinge helix DNA binding protein